MPATQPIAPEVDPPFGIQADDADQMLERQAIRASRPGVKRTRSNGNSTVGGSAVSGSTRVRGGSI